MKEKTFEENIKRLEEIVGNLEEGNIDLDNAVESFKEAIDLANKCDKKLKEATESVNKILNKNGELEEFKLEEE